MFQQPAHNNHIDTEEGQLKALAVSAHHANTILNLVEHKEEVKKLDERLANFSEKHKEVLEALETQKQQARALEDHARIVEARAAEIEQFHQENLVRVQQEHEFRMAEFSEHVEGRQTELRGMEEATMRKCQNMEMETNRRVNEVVKREQAADIREGSLNNAIEKHRQNLVAHEERVEQLNDWEVRLDKRHDEVTQLEKNALKKG